MVFAVSTKRSYPYRTAPERKKATPCGVAFSIFRRRPTLPGSFPPSTIGAEGLNDSVRKGKRWIPLAITTGKRLGKHAVQRPLPENYIVIMVFEFKIRPRAISTS
jgi:hypothetical protein